MDIVILATDPKLYLASSDSLKSIDDFWITFLEPTATGDEMELRVMFRGGLDVDFAIISHAKVEGMIQQGLPPEVAEMLRRGAHVLLDKDGLPARRRPLSTEPEASHPLTHFEFVEAINDFWYHAVWTAKKLWLELPRFRGGLTARLF